MEAGRVSTHAIARFRTVLTLKSGAVGRHGTRPAGRKHLGGPHRQPKPIRRADGKHRLDFRRGALPVGQMMLADFFSHR